jgi:hypothetical protein
MDPWSRAAERGRGDDVRARRGSGRGVRKLERFFIDRFVDGRRVSSVSTDGFFLGRDEGAVAARRGFSGRPRGGTPRAALEARRHESHPPVAA